MPEDKWGEIIEYGEDAEKEKNIKTARTVFTMTCLDFVLDEKIHLGLLQLEVEGWEAHAPCGDGEALRGANDTCFIVCEVWDVRDKKRRHLSLRGANVFGPPCDDVLAAMVEHPNFERIDDIVDTDKNMCFCFKGRKIWGGGGRLR